MTKKKSAKAEKSHKTEKKVEAAPDQGSKKAADESARLRDCEKELAQAREEIAELKDKLLRAHAEMDNLRKRTERQIADAHKFGIEKFATSLLDVMDNLERALESPEGNEAGVREGIRLTLNSWHDVMKKFQVERIDAVGKPFDPHLHEALSQMPSDEPQGTVIAQHVAGYTLHGRLIRPAKVLVSSGPAQSDAGKGEAEERGE